MNNHELPPMERSEANIDSAAIDNLEGKPKELSAEEEAGQEETFDPEKGKQEYSEARLEWASLEAEYNSLSEKQSGFADAVIADKNNATALLDLKIAGMKLDEIRDKRDQAGGKSTELFFKLLEAEGGAKNTEAAEALFEKGLTQFIQENPELAEYLVEGSSEIPGFAESAEKMKRLTEKVSQLAEMQAESNTLILELNGLNAEMTRLKAEKEEKENEHETLLKDPGQNAGNLKQNIIYRQGIAKQMQEVGKRMNELTRKFEDLTERVRDAFKD